MALTNEPKVGTISGQLEQNQYGYEPRSRVYAGRNWGWQTESSYQKTIKHRGGAAFYDSLQERLSPIRDLVAGAVKPFAPVLNGINGVLENSHAGPLLEQVNGATEYIEDLAVQNGFDRRVGTSAVMLGEEVVTAGLGKGVSSLAKGISKLPPPKPMLAVAGGGVSVNSPPIQLPSKGALVNELTIKNPDRIANGVKQGIASGDDFGPAMRKWNARRNELIEQRRYPQGLTANRRLKNQRKSLVTAYNDVSTGPTRDPLDVEAYGRKEYKVTGMEQHHLFPKQESYQFIEQMKKIGDDDDVLNLFLYAEELDSTMGGRLSDMLNMNKKPHNNLHANRIKDGRQLNAMKMKNLVSSAKSTDELMDLFDNYIRDNVIPSKAEAKALQKAFDSSRSTLNQFKSLSENARRRL
jgi:hypothetical protein